MSCNCVEEMNKLLEPKNARLGIALQITKTMDIRARVQVWVEKIDKTKRKPPPAVVTSFCPFCGVKEAD